MTRAQFAIYNNFFIDYLGGNGLITAERHRTMNDKVRQYVDEAVPFQTTLLYEPEHEEIIVGVSVLMPEYWYISDPRLTGKTVIRLTGQTFILTSSDLAPIPSLATGWKITQEDSTFITGAPVVVDFYEP